METINVGVGSKVEINGIEFICNHMTINKDLSMDIKFISEIEFNSRFGIKDKDSL